MGSRMHGLAPVSRRFPGGCLPVPLRLWPLAVPGVLANFQPCLVLLLSLILLPPGAAALNTVAPVERPKEPEAVATVPGPNLIRMTPGSLLEKKLRFPEVRAERLTSPLLSVTGAVTARLRAGPGAVEDRWQFSSVELSTIYADWQKAGTEQEFAAKQLVKTRELTVAQLNAQRLVVERLRKLVATGTEAVRELTTAEANMLQTQLSGQKAVFDAENAAMQAEHSEADLERRLVQAGVDPALLRQVPAEAVLVMADVPEIRLSLVAVGQACEARFYSLPEQLFTGHVRSLSPAVSPERRTLRVFFQLNDREGHLKPGMYADIGLGTDPRQAIVIPSDSVLHINSTDYVLIDQGAGNWRVAPVQVGERSGEQVEILHGLTVGQRLIGEGSILLKPLVVQALLLAVPAPAAPAAGP